MTLLKNSVKTVVGKKKVEYGIKVYEILQSEYNRSLPLNENVIFMEIFDNYYHLREERRMFKDISNKMAFFERFNEYKNLIMSGTTVSLDRIIEDISSITGQCEGVFATKIYHTLYNDKPILDRVLAEHFDIKTTHYSCKTTNARIGYFINAYEEYLSKFEAYQLSDPEAKTIISEFDKKYQSSISDVKKLDLVLWADR